MNQALRERFRRIVAVADAKWAADLTSLREVLGDKAALQAQARCLTSQELKCLNQAIARRLRP